MDSEAHSVCEVCAPGAKRHGQVFTGELRDSQCCFCGYAHGSGLMVSLDDVEGNRITPWWCGAKLGIHRARKVVAA